NPQRGLILTDPSLWVVATSSVISSDQRRPAHEKHICYRRSVVDRDLVRGPHQRPDAARPAQGGRRDVFRRVSRRIRIQPGTVAARQLAVHRRRTPVEPTGSAGPPLPGHAGGPPSGHPPLPP